MIQTNVIRLILTLSLLPYSTFLMAQDIKKEQIFFLFEKNNGQHDKVLGKKFIDEKGINFNLYKYYFIHKDKMKKDTLCIKELEKYILTKERELKEKENFWRKKNKEKLKQKYNLLYRQIDRNSVFDINIIEKINNNKIVIYQVELRNEGAIP